MGTKVYACLAMVVAFLAYLASQNPLLARHYFVMVTFGKFPGVQTYGPSCDDVPLQNPQLSTRYSKHRHCFNETGQLFWHDVKRNESATKEIINKAIQERCPVLVYRPFSDHKCLQRLKELGNANLNATTIRVKQNSDRLMDGCTEFPNDLFFEESKTRVSYRAPLKDLLDEYDQGHSTKFTAFDPSLHVSTYANLWGTDLSWLLGVSGTTFLSNYNRTIITAPYHSAFWESFAYQCEGTKNWRFMTPEDALPTVRLHNVFTAMKGCDGRPDIRAMGFDVQTRPDTLFYFPNYWAHAVESEKGLQVLLNYRAMYSFNLMYRDNLLLRLLTNTAVIYQLLFYSAWDPDEVTYYYTTGKVPEGKKNQRSRLVELLESWWRFSVRVVRNKLQLGDEPIVGSFL